MFCDQCGAAAKSNAKFCHNCGHQIQGEVEPISAPQEIQPPVSIADDAPLQMFEVPEKQPEPQVETTIPSVKVFAGHHPWRRLFARTVDMALAAPLLYLLLFNNFGKNNPFAELFFGTYGAVWVLDRPVFIVVLIYVLWVPIEAAFLTWFGATIGKWAFGIRVLDADGNRLSYGPALERSLWVLSTGVAFGIPFVILVSGFIAYKRLEKKGVTFWDERVESSVLCHPWTLAGSVICAFVSVLTLFCAVLMPVIVAKLQINYWAGRGNLPPLSSSTNVSQPNHGPATKGITEEDLKGFRYNPNGLTEEELARFRYNQSSGVEQPNDPHSRGSLGDRCSYSNDCSATLACNKSGRCFDPSKETREGKRLNSSTSKAEKKVDSKATSSGSLGSLGDQCSYSKDCSGELVCNISGRCYDPAKENWEGQKANR